MQGFVLREGVFLQGGGFAHTGADRGKVLFRVPILQCASRPNQNGWLLRFQAASSQPRVKGRSHSTLSTHTMVIAGGGFFWREGVGLGRRDHGIAKRSARFSNWGVLDPLLC